MRVATLLARVWDRLRSSYWFVPTACIAAAVALAVGLIAADHSLQRGGVRYSYAGGPESASATLTTIATSMITFTGLVFSITIVAIQLTSSQFSPRALRNFLRDRVPQWALGVFIATFAYAFTALAAVRYGARGEPGFVPSITVTGALLLIAASTVLFVQLIHHMAHSLRATTIIHRIARETRETIERVCPDDDVLVGRPEWNATPVEVRARRTGVVTDVDLQLLAEQAHAVGATVEVLHPVGDFVCEDMPILLVHGPRVTPDMVASWHRMIHLGAERTSRQDVAFGLRQLVDIAERALSPAVNDPTTAVECLDQLHDLLRRLIRYSLPRTRGVVLDGRLAACTPAFAFEDYLDLALEEIQHWGRDSIQVHRRVAAILADLATLTDDARRLAALEEHRWMLRVATHERRDREPAHLRTTRS